jgi:hypothetical protein
MVRPGTLRRFAPGLIALPPRSSMRTKLERAAKAEHATFRGLARTLLGWGCSPSPDPQRFELAMERRTLHADKLRGS